MTAAPVVCRPTFRAVSVVESEVARTYRKRGLVRTIRSIVMNVTKNREPTV